MRKPKLIISKCLNSEKCRYDGQGFDDKVISSLRKYIDITTVCPEQEIGLDTPRDPIRIEKHGEEYKLIQPSLGTDYSNHMNEFAEEFIKGIDDIDGFILKSKSPSCGIKDAKVYPKNNKCSIAKNKNGFFSDKVINHGLNIPIENEGRLKNYIIRDEFLTKIFTINSLKESEDLQDFHKNNHLLLKSYDKDAVYEIEKNILSQDFNEDNKSRYKEKVFGILNGKRNKKSKIDVANMAFDRYKDMLSKEEVEHNELMIQQYQEKKIPYSTIIMAMKMYGIRFNDKELLTQSYFTPYPQELISITDSGKGRDL